jgi:SAM-dependent methyltransferase
MNHRDAVALIAKAVSGRAGCWADLGAGAGTFTRALTELLGAGSRIYAVDRDAGAIARIARRSTAAGEPLVIPVIADFTGTFELPGLDASELDGLLFANSLHFVRDSGQVLGKLVELLRPNGRVVVVEYDGRGPDRWVPYPISAQRFAELCASAGLSAPRTIATRPSAFGGTIYAAAADRE